MVPPPPFCLQHLHIQRVIDSYTFSSACVFGLEPLDVVIDCCSRLGLALNSFLLDKMIDISEVLQAFLLATWGAGLAWPAPRSRQLKDLLKSSSSSSSSSRKAWIYVWSSE